MSTHLFPCLQVQPNKFYVILLLVYPQTMGEIEKEGQSLLCDPVQYNSGMNHKY